MNGGAKIAKAALFLDFDNVYLSLRDQDEQAAESFAERPEQWLSWLEGDLVGGFAGDPQRRILLRRCYLNPGTFYRARPNFVRAAFQVVDCPPLTSAGKNAADIQMVMDIIDALAHPSGFEEFIILSGDSDFTPVLLRLRAHDRRTSILALGISSRAYRAAADLVIDDETFREQAINAQAPPVVAVPIPGSAALDIPTPATADRGAVPDQEALLARARDVIETMVRDADEPLPSAVVVDRLRGAMTLGNDLGGWHSFKALVLALPNHVFDVDWGVPGWFYDPSRHELPDKMARQVDFSDPEVESVARLVCAVTDVPLLSAEQYHELFDLIAKEVSTNGYYLTRTSRWLRDAAKGRGMPAGRADANFVLVGITRAGVYLPAGAPVEPVNPDDLAVAFLGTVEAQALAAQVTLVGDEKQALMRWIAPEPPG